MELFHTKPLRQAVLSIYVYTLLVQVPFTSLFLESLPLTPTVLPCSQPRTMLLQRYFLYSTNLKSTVSFSSSAAISSLSNMSHLSLFSRPFLMSLTLFVYYWNVCLNPWLVVIPWWIGDDHRHNFDVLNHLLVSKFRFQDAIAKWINL